MRAGRVADTGSQRLRRCLVEQWRRSASREVCDLSRFAARRRQRRSVPSGSPTSPVSSRGPAPAAGRRRRHRRRRARSTSTEPGQDVVGSHGRCHVPYDQCSIAQGCSPSVGVRHHLGTTSGRARRGVRTPSLVSRSHEDLVGGEEACDARRPPSAGSTGQPDLPRRGLERSASDGPAGASTHLAATSIPSGRQASRAARTQLGLAARSASAISTYSASLATPVGAAPTQEIFGCGREAGAVGHRHAGAAQRALEGAGEVPVGGEAEPAALGVAQPQPLDRRGRGRAVGGALGHPARDDRERQQGLAGRPDLDVGAHARADPAVEAGDPPAVVELLPRRSASCQSAQSHSLSSPESRWSHGSTSASLALAGGVPVDVDADLLGRRASSGRRRSARSSRRSAPPSRHDLSMTAPTRRSPRESRPSTMPGLPSW